jgi:hypothetical protein
MGFSIGQVIYVLSDKTQTVLPGIVREEILRRSPEGEKVSYRVAIGPSSKQRVVDLSTVDGEVYGDLQEIRQVLIERLTSYVDDLCQTTNQRVSVWYGDAGPGARPAATNPGDKVDPSVLMNEVSAGQPPMLRQQVQQPQQSDHLPGIRSSARANLRDAIIDPELTTREFVNPDGSISRISPDGTVSRV